MSRTVRTTAPPTERQIRACAPFGLELRAEAAAPAAPVPTAHEQVRHALSTGGVALLTGPSGSGKSTCLRALADTLRRSGRPVLDLCRAPGLGRLLIDLFGAGVGPEQTLARLARFGLAEPALAARTVGELSEGQRHRARLALAFHRARRTPDPWLLIDEFASVLDRVTAIGLAATLRRAAVADAVRVVCATAHDDLTQALRPHLHLHFGLDASVRTCPAPTHRSPSPLRVEAGDHADLDALLAHHYLSGRPATRVRILRAVDRARGHLAGVLVVSMPTLNGRWRQQAWPGRYAGVDRRAAAARLNAELRCISRVVVDPRYRGLGVATRLVRAYLDEPLSPATEAVAAMGPICPFFERAGMTPYRVPRHAADDRLADALESVGACGWMLADAERAAALVREPLVASELERWSRARRVAAGSTASLCRAAGARLCVRPMAYAAVVPPDEFRRRRRRGGPDGESEASAN